MQVRLQDSWTSDKALKHMSDRLEGYGGLIALDSEGNFCASYTTKNMVWASVKDGKLESHI